MWDDQSSDNFERWAEQYYSERPELKQAYLATHIVRKPVAGIISGYHQLPYILVTPDDDNPRHSIEINGKVNVSPKFVISPGALAETFGDVFDPETFDKEIQGRLFSFSFARKKNLKIQSEYVNIANFEIPAQEHLDSLHDRLMMNENIKTALVFGPAFQYYPVSIDRFITEIVEREFRV
jgi:hypothetical protein